MPPASLFILISSTVERFFAVLGDYCITADTSFSLLPTAGRAATTTLPVTLSGRQDQRDQSQIFSFISPPASHGPDHSRSVLNFLKLWSTTDLYLLLAAVSESLLLLPARSLWKPGKAQLSVLKQLSQLLLCALKRTILSRADMQQRPRIWVFRICDPVLQLNQAE